MCAQTEVSSIKKKTELILFISLEFDIERIYNYFYDDYFSKKIIYDTLYQGGGRALFFYDETAKLLPFVSKYPLIYVEQDDIILNSHYNFPFEKNLICKPQAVLKHYKFLPKDKKKYIERINKANFSNGSIEYKMYNNMNDESYNEKAKKLKEYKGIDSIDISKF